ncbi:DUF1707 domain-containing protein [Micromonospora sp. NPDC049559]|uniref:DUF1707 SHOCT-like domain-containing protein n=1 Tax=Micromonospora sp. NPDC049559 TaxID=3155923 RepID=UPI00344657C0
MLGAVERRGEMRAADADREAVAERLRIALNEGRLDLNEYDERLQRTYAAKTYADLDGLLDDLPAPRAPRDSQVVPAAEPVPPPAPKSGDRYRPGARRWLAWSWGQYVAGVAVVTVIWGGVALSTGQPHGFWPIWVAGPWGAILLGRTITVLSGGDPRDRPGRQRRRDRRDRYGRGGWAR